MAEQLKNIYSQEFIKKLSNIDFVTFVYKIIIAYLIYQFIVSIRQNTRRK